MICTLHHLYPVLQKSNSFQFNRITSITSLHKKILLISCAIFLGILTSFHVIKHFFFKPTPIAPSNSTNLGLNTITANAQSNLPSKSGTKSPKNIPVIPPILNTKPNSEMETQIVKQELIIEDCDVPKDLANTISVGLSMQLANLYIGFKKHPDSILKSHKKIKLDDLNVVIEVDMKQEKTQKIARSGASLFKNTAIVNITPDNDLALKAVAKYFKGKELLPFYFSNPYKTTPFDKILVNNQNLDTFDKNHFDGAQVKLLDIISPTLSNGLSWLVNGYEKCNTPSLFKLGPISQKITLDDLGVVIEVNFMHEKKPGKNFNPIVEIVISPENDKVLKAIWFLFKDQIMPTLFLEVPTFDQVEINGKNLKM